MNFEQIIKDSIAYLSTEEEELQDEEIEEVWKNKEDSTANIITRRYTLEYLSWI